MWLMGSCLMLYLSSSFFLTQVNFLSSTLLKCSLWVGGVTFLPASTAEDLEIFLLALGMQGFGHPKVIKVPVSFPSPVPSEVSKLTAN